MAGDGPALRDLRLLIAERDCRKNAVAGIPDGGFVRQNGCTESEPITTAAMRASEL
jgi:hypothetical protein